MNETAAITPLYLFFWGFSGSLAVEVVTLVQYYYSPGGDLPDRYGRFGFYVVRLLLAAIGGALAIGYKINNPILAINIGAATPLIIQSFAQSPPHAQHSAVGVATNPHESAAVTPTRGARDN